MDKIKLIVGYYGRNNIGDDLMLKVLYNPLSYVFLQGDNFYDFIPSEKQILLSQKPFLKFNKTKLPITEKISKEIVSIPIYPLLSSRQTNKIINVINNF